MREEGNNVTFKGKSKQISVQIDYIKKVSNCVLITVIISTYLSDNTLTIPSRARVHNYPFSYPYAHGDYQANVEIGLPASFLPIRTWGLQASIAASSSLPLPTHTHMGIT